MYHVRSHSHWLKFVPALTAERKKTAKESVGREKSQSRKGRGGKIKPLLCQHVVPSKPSMTFTVKRTKISDIFWMRFFFITMWAAVLAHFKVFTTCLRLCQSGGTEWLQVEPFFFLFYLGLPLWCWLRLFLELHTSFLSNECRVQFQEELLCRFLLY